MVNVGQQQSGELAVQKVIAFAKGGESVQFLTFATTLIA